MVERAEKSLSASFGGPEGLWLKPPFGRLAGIVLVVWNVHAAS